MGEGSWGLRLPVLGSLALAALAGCTSLGHHHGAGASCPPQPVPLCGPAPPAPAAPRYVNLVFEGGGVKGVAYAGALEVLERRGVLGGIRRVAGTSAGAIGATLVALGYTPDEIRRLLLDLDFLRFEDGSTLGGPFRLIRRFGWYRGAFFLDWMRDRVRQKTGAPDTTFAELRAQPDRFRELYVVGSDLSRRRVQVFSHTTSPDLPVAQAVRSSMSIPLFFEAAHVASSRFGKAGGTDLFVDGGILANFPIFIFDQPPFVPVEQVNRETLGFVLEDLHRSADARVEIRNFRDYTKELVETILSVQESAFRDSADDRARTVVIDNLGVRTTDFEITLATKCALMHQAAVATCEYLERHPP